MASEATITTANGNYLCDGIQLRPRKLVPRWLGDAILWTFFHRKDTTTRLFIYGLADNAKGDRA